MVQTISQSPHDTAPRLTLDFTSIRLTAAQFDDLCRDNPDMRLELTSKAELIVMPPAGSKTGQRNFNLNSQFGRWVETDGTGLGFDSSTGFTLPDKAILSPDASWIRRERWDALSEKEQEGFAPICPDFVIELRSSSNSLKSLQHKMREYIGNGAQLGWLINPPERRVYIYRTGEEVEVLSNAETVSADPILPGFVLQLTELW